MKRTLCLKYIGGFFAGNVEHVFFDAERVKVKLDFVFFDARWQIGEKLEGVGTVWQWNQFAFVKLEQTERHRMHGRYTPGDHHVPYAKQKHRRQHTGEQCDQPDQCYDKLINAIIVHTIE